MRETFKNQVVILELNAGLVNREVKILKELGLDFKLCLGSYKSEVNPSYAVLIKSKDDLLKVFGLAEKYRQESILLLREDRSAVLLYTDETPDVELGYFVGVSEHVAYKEDAWTLDVKNKQYYICKGA